MTHTARITRYSRKALIRIGAGIVLGLVASSSLSVMSRDTDGVKLPAGYVPPVAEDSCDSHFMAACDPVMKEAIAQALDPSTFKQNTVFADKGDDGAYYTEASHDRKFDPCAYSDGRPYSGKGTVLNPHADFDGCLPTVAVASDAFFAEPGFDLEGGGDAASTVDPGGEYLSVFGPGGFLAGPIPSTGIPFAQIVTGIPTFTPDTPITDIPTGDAVPLPAPALLFLTGLAGLIGVRKKKAAA